MYNTSFITIILIFYSLVFYYTIYTLYIFNKQSIKQSNKQEKILFTKHKNNKININFILNINNNTMNLSKQSGDKELFYGVQTKENNPEINIFDKTITFIINLKNDSLSINYGIINNNNNNSLSELFIIFIEQENEIKNNKLNKNNKSNKNNQLNKINNKNLREDTMNLSKQSVDKELFSGTIVEENIPIKDNIYLLNLKEYIHYLFAELIF
jgi:hypothetical protein